MPSLLLTQNHAFLFVFKGIRVILKLIEPAKASVRKRILKSAGHLFLGAC